MNESPECDWQPGECIPTGSLSVDFHSLLSEMQCSLSSELIKLQGTLSSVVDRLSHLEESVALSTTKLSSQTLCLTPSTSSCESSGGCSSSRKRKRRLPTELSVSVYKYVVHNIICKHINS